MSDLKTDYKDDVLDVSANVKRIFNLVDQDGKIVVANVSIQDITKYTQEGDSFGAADINATNEAVNGKLDGSSTVDPMLATEEGFAADAYQTKLQLEEQNKNMGGLRFGVDADGNCGYIKDGADTVTPFKKGYEDTPGTATAKMITKGFTAWVNGELITGERPLPTNTQKGSKTFNTITWGRVVDFTITFPVEFDSIPSVSLAGSSCTKHDFDQLKVLSTTRSYFTGRFEPGGTPDSGYSDVVINWTAAV